MAEPRKINIKLVRSLIGAHKQHRKIAAALGLSKVNQVVTHLESKTILGMIQKIAYLVEVEAA